MQGPVLGDTGNGPANAGRAEKHTPPAREDR